MDDGLLKGILYQHGLVYARQLWRYKWLSIGVAWLVCVVGWPVVSLIPPKYESSARVYVSADQYLTPLLKGLATDVDPRRQVEYLQRTLLSRPNLEQVIHLSNLDLTPSGKISDAEREEKSAAFREADHAYFARAEPSEDHLPEFQTRRSPRMSCSRC